MKKWLLRAAGLGVSAVLIVMVLAWITLRGSLPTLDGEFRVRGLAAVATIERDADGIATITASTRTDVAYATGFAHGQDRFFQMDLIRRRSAGELSELFGSIALDTDKRFRWNRFRALAKQNIAVMPSQEVVLLGRYTAGVNDALNSLSANPFEYYLLGVDPEPWKPEDSILVAFTMYLNLNDERADRDLQRGLAHGALPPEMYAFMYPQGTSWDAPLMGDARETGPIPSAEIMSVRDVTDEPSPTKEIGKPDINGSNNWAVGGALTASGRALVSNDMHLGLSVPGIWYQARLVVDGDEPRDVTGVVLPGSPFVVSGSNTKVAWGNTNSYGDWTDAVILRPGASQGTYRTENGDLPFVEHVERIDVKDADPVDFVIRQTIWGPVHDRVDYPDGEIAVSWTAHHVAALNLNLTALETAESVADALDIANTLGMPPQNFVAGDIDGNIGWTIAGRIPLRSDYNPLLPADWSTGGGWVGWLEPEQYPRIINPDSGRIWTANARVADGEALAMIGDSGYDLGARAGQIRDGLFAKDRFEVGDMLAIQIDDRALFLSRWRDLLLSEIDDQLVTSDPKMAEYRQLVADWIPRAVPESVGYRLVRAFRLEVQARVFHGLMGPARAAYGDDVKLRISNQFEGPLWALVTEQPMHMLPGQYDNWQALFAGAVSENILYFTENFGESLAERTWGERNTARIRHPLSGAVPLLGDYLNMPAEPVSGDVDLPRAQGPTFGASQRFSVTPGDEANSLMHMPTGQSGHPLSDFYRRGHEDWVQGRQSPFLPGETQHKLLLRPAD